jgi:hypothetical protein
VSWLSVNEYAPVYRFRSRALHQSRRPAGIRSYSQPSEFLVTDPFPIGVSIRFQARHVVSGTWSMDSDLLTTHNSVAVRGTQRELSQTPRPIRGRRQHCCPLREKLIVEGIYALDFPVSEVRVITQFRCWALISALAEHDPETVTDKEAPTLGINPRLSEPENVDIVAGRYSKIPNREHAPGVHNSGHLLIGLSLQSAYRFGMPRELSSNLEQPDTTSSFDLWQ